MTKKKTAIVPIHEIAITSTHAQHLATARATLIEKMKSSWKTRQKYYCPDPPSAVNSAYPPDPKLPFLDTSIFDRKASPRLSHARKKALGMKILHDNISTDLGRHLHLLKALDASGRNRMRKWRQRKREVRADIAANLPWIAEVQDEDTHADLAPAAVYVLYGNCRGDGMITTMYGDRMVGVLSTDEFKRWDRWDRRRDSIVAREVRKRRRKEKFERSRKVVCRQLRRMGRWMQRTVTECAARVMRGDCKCSCARADDSKEYRKG